MSAAEVRVEPAFGAAIPFYVARTAAASERFPHKLPGSIVGVMMGSAAGIDPETARARAFAELVEHVSGFDVASEGTDLLRDTPCHLKDSVAPLVILPSSLQHFAAWQRVPGFIERQPDEHLRTWCRGFRVATGEPALVPAQAVFLQWRVPKDESIFLESSATGLAAGMDRTSTLLRALLEVIERDACMMSWRVASYPLTRLPASVIPALFQEVCAALRLAVELFRIDTDGLPCTIVACVSREGGVGLTCGSACGIDDGGAIGKALSEALMLQWTMRNYRPGNAPDIECPHDSYEHVAAAFQTRGPHVAEWYGGQAARVETNRRAECPEGLEALALAAERVFMSPVIAVDLASFIARNSGWHVYRVVIPSALPKESDALIPHLGGSRIGAYLGCHPQVRVGLHLDPHPFG